MSERESERERERETLVSNLITVFINTRTQYVIRYMDALLFIIISFSRRSENGLKNILYRSMSH